MGSGSMIFTAAEDLDLLVLSPDYREAFEALQAIAARVAALEKINKRLDPFMDTPRVKRFSTGCVRVIGCSHLSGLKGAAI